MLVDFGFDLAGRKDPRLKRGAIWSVLGGLAELLPIIIAYFVLEGVVRERISQDWVYASAAALFVSVGLSALFKALGSLANFTSTYSLVCDARVRLADHLRRLPMGFWTKRRTGEVSSVLTDEFSLYSEVVTHVWSLIIASLAKPAGICVILFLLDWRMGLIATVASFAGLAAIPWTHRVLNRASDRLHRVKSDSHSVLVEYAQGVETLREFDRCSAYHPKIDSALRLLEKEQMRMELAPAPIVLSFKLVAWLGFCSMVLFGAGWVSDGSLDPLHLLLLLVLSLQLFEGASEISTFLALARFASRTLERIRALFDEDVQHSVVGGPGDNDLRQDDMQKADISIREISFSYEDRPAIRDLSASIPFGSVTALVGRSGSGKSTLAHLLNRLWDVQQGSIKVGTQRLDEIPLSQLRRQIAMVLQDVVLFRDTVENNIRLGRPGASREEVIRSAQAAQAHRFIQDLEHGYATVLSRGGQELSGGQRQRLAIARALLHDAPILILDEATASVDLESEAEIQEALGHLMVGRTVVVIAHRLWTIQSADQILFLQDGELIEQGAHDSLIEAQGPYRRLWDAQQGPKKSMPRS